jgi:hypothetical protein
MSKASRNRSQQHGNQTHNTGASMSTAQEIKKEEQQVNHDNKVEIKKEAMGLKPDAKSETPKTEAKKGGLIDIPVNAAKAVYEKAILPTWETAKGIAMRGWDWCVNTTNSEVAEYKLLGAGRYLLNRVTSGLIKILKLAVVLTAASFVNGLVMNMTGYSLFAPSSLLVILVTAVVFIGIKSYLAQKDMGAKFSFKQLGADMMNSATC